MQHIAYNESYAGLPVYVRYWNDASLTATSHYGNTPLFYLPSAGTPGQVQVDVLPTGSDQIATYQIPTLTEWGLILMAGLLAWIGARKFMSRPALIASASP